MTQRKMREINKEINGAIKAIKTAENKEQAKAEAKNIILKHYRSGALNPEDASLLIENL